jgi:hypothetical protein
VAIATAAENGNTPMVAMLLDIVDPSELYCYSLRLACHEGHHDVIDLLDKYFSKSYPDYIERRKFYQSQYDQATEVKKVYRDAFARLFDLKV